MSRIPLISPDIPSFEELETEFRTILESGRVTNFGNYVQQFERAVTEYLGCEAVTTSSCTVGLLFALQALGLQRNQKVVLPSFTFTATAQAIEYAGGIPLYAECDDNLTLCTDDLAELLDQHNDVGAVMPVHVFGMPCSTKKIESIVAAYSQRKSRKVPVIYDAAHAFGSQTPEGKVGSFGDVEVFSLSVTKVLISIEGGLIASRQPEIISAIRKMRNYGFETGYNAVVPGLNGKMSELHAVVGLKNLNRVDELISCKQELATYYRKRIDCDTNFSNLPWPEGVIHTFKDFTVLVPEELSGRRDHIMKNLKEMEIETRAYFYPPVHQQSHFQRFSDRPLPQTESYSQRVITLPFFSTMTKDQIDVVVDALSAAERSLV